MSDETATARRIQSKVSAARAAIRRRAAASGRSSTVSDCRSAEGVVVGLIDGMIAQARVVAEYLREHCDEPKHEEIRKALADLRSDRDVLLVADWDSANSQIRW